MMAFEPASKLFELQVQDVRGEFVGWVAELLMDVTRGQIEYVLIRLSSKGKREPVQVTVPWSVVRADTRTSERWQVSVNKSVLERLAEVVPGA